MSSRLTFTVETWRTKQTESWENVAAIVWRLYCNLSDDDEPQTSILLLQRSHSPGITTPNTTSYKIRISSFLTLAIFVEKQEDLKSWNGSFASLID